MKEKIEEIVRTVVIKYLSNKNFQENTTKKHLLILLEDNSRISKDVIWEKISTLSRTYNISLCLDQSWSEIPEQLVYENAMPLDTEQLHSIYKIVSETDLIVIPAPTFATLAKLALTIDDHLAVKILIQAQLSGKQILLLNDSLTPKGEQKIVSPPSLQKRIKTYLKQIREDQIQITSLDKLLKWVDGYFEGHMKKRPIVLAKHVEEVSVEGFKELIVPKGSILTPTSKDTAKELGVSIKYKE